LGWGGGKGGGGQDQGLERLFRREYAGLVRTLTVVVGSADAAADAVQDAFVQASRHWPRVRAYDDPASWLRRVALHRALNQRRGWQRREAALHRLAPLRPTVEDAEPAVDFDAALDRLPRRQRAVVALYYVADLPVAEIAAVLGLAEGTVKSHLHDARRALAPRLEVDDGHR
jgi:RNA polymerase sigma-70 factor (ECF subfamily)